MQSKSFRYINGLDWVRAIMSLLVVTWHMYTFGKSLLYTEQFAQFRINLTDVINFHIGTVPVPVFLMISAYLLARTRTEWPRVRHRLWRVILLTTFWTVLLSIWRGGYVELRKMIPTSFTDLVVTIFSVNGEYYYFFSSLIVSILLAYVFSRLPTGWSAAAFLLATALDFFLPQIALATGQYVLIAYWNPLNFLAYPFAAILIARCQDRLLANGRTAILSVAAMLVLCALFSWYEWTHYVQGAFLAEGVAYPLHTRASQIFFGSAIILAGLWPWRTAPAVIRFMSRHSLALYVLHDFFRPVILANTPPLHWPDQVIRLVQYALVVLLCYGASLILTAFIKEDLIR